MGGNLLELFIYVVIGIFLLGFIFGPKGGRIKSGTKDLKNEFPGIIVLFLIGTLITIIIVAIRGY